MTPVVGDIEFVEVGVAVEKFLDGKAGCQRTHEACAQRDQAGFQIFEFTSPAQCGRIGDTQYAAGQARVLFDDGGQLAHRCLLIFDSPDQSQQNLWRGGYPRDINGFENRVGKTAHGIDEFNIDE